MANSTETNKPVSATQDASLHNGHQATDAAEAAILTEPQGKEPNEDDITEFIETAQHLERELTSIVVGQERVIRELLLALLAGGHVLLEGVPGLGKTLLVRTLSDALSLKFARIQFTPDLMPASIVGTTILTEQVDPGSSSPSAKRVFSFQP